MSYQVIARKWRPQEFGAIVGQDAVVRSLTNALEQDRVAHAFLFSGVRGVGKTTTARILAKALNCERGPTTEPCGECASCVEIADSASIDVLEIDAASNTGVDNIRDLRESSRYGTARDRFKIFIIDEVHMLSRGAFNALLKTLEEPPDHVKFILATTEDQKVPITIRSRCQHYEFKPIPFGLILERLRLIAEQDDITSSDEALRTIAARAEGSLRDAQSALDQVLAFSGREIADEDVRQVLGVVDRSLVAEVFDAVLDRNREALIRSLVSLGENAITPADLCHGLVEYLRVLMLCRTAGWDPELLEIGDSDRARVEGHAARVSEIDLIRFYDLASATEAELKWHRHPQAHLEISLLKLIELAHLPSLEKVLSGLGPGGEIPRPPRPEADSRGRPTPKTENPHRARPPEPEPESGPQSESEPESVSPAPPSAAAPPAPGRDPVAQLLALLQSESMGLYQHLYRADEIELSSDLLRVVFSASERIHAEFLEDPQRSAQLLSACEKIVGSRPAIDLRVDAEPQTAAQDPTDDPGVQELLKRYPGKVIVNREPS